MSDRKNKLYTLSYFRKRLKENNIKSVRLINKFADDDDRYWTILISPNHKNIICTCYKTDSEYFFNFHTSKYFKYQIKTQSMEVIIKTMEALIKDETPNE